MIFCVAREFGRMISVCNGTDDPSPTKLSIFLLRKIDMYFIPDMCFALDMHFVRDFFRADDIRPYTEKSGKGEALP